MTIQQKLFALIIGAGVFLIILEMVRRRRLAEEYSFLWLATGLGIVVLVLWYDILERLTRFYRSQIQQQHFLYLGLFFNTYQSSLFCEDY